MDNFKFRRQFLLSPEKCEQLKDWNYGSLGTYHLHVHPDCGLTVSKSSSIELALIGYIIDPHNPAKSDRDILNDISKGTTIDEVYEKLYYYSGRFVLVVKQSEDYTIFHDPCGLKSVFYTKFKNQIYAASQALLFKLLIPLTEGSKYFSYYNSTYVKYDIEHWIPSGCSLYDDVYQLVPNHYLKFSTLSQIRYWPDRKRTEIHFDNGIEQVSSLLTKIMVAANRRFKLALPLTAGWDSRCILSACKPIAEDLYFYTLQYRDLTESSTDIGIPRKLLTKLGYEHHIIDCRKPVDEDFSNIYTANTDIPHLNDWGVTAHGMLSEYPHERVAIKGSCTEIARCAYYRSGKHNAITSVEDLEILEKWKNTDFIRNELSQWLLEIKDANANKGYDLLDLFYWEHRMGGWQSQSQLEWDIVQEEFTPFNNRALLGTMLAVDASYRREPDYIFFEKLIQNLWKETLLEPINPKLGMEKVKYVLKGILKKAGLFALVKKKFRSLKRHHYELKNKRLAKDN